MLERGPKGGLLQSKVREHMNIKARSHTGAEGRFRGGAQRLVGLRVAIVCILLMRAPREGCGFGRKVESLELYRRRQKWERMKADFATTVGHDG